MISGSTEERLARKITSVGFQFSLGVFTVKDAYPEQTLERFKEYVEAMQMAFSQSRRVNPRWSLTTQIRRKLLSWREAMTWWTSSNMWGR